MNNSSLPGFELLHWYSELCYISLGLLSMLLICKTIYYISSEKLSNKYASFLLFFIDEVFFFQSIGWSLLSSTTLHCTTPCLPVAPSTSQLAMCWAAYCPGPILVSSFGIKLTAPKHPRLVLSVCIGIVNSGWYYYPYYIMQDVLLTESEYRGAGLSLWGDLGSDIFYNS